MNNKTVRLIMRGKILSIINVNPRFVRLKPNNEGKVKTELTFSTAKPDLRITEVKFEESKSNSRKKLEAQKTAKPQGNFIPTWQMLPEITMERNETADSDGYYSYAVNLSMNISPDKTISGNFTFFTNHREKESINIRGIIIPLEENSPNQPKAKFKPKKKTN